MDSYILALISGNELVENTENADEEIIMITPETIFYAESGGQIYDTGKITWSSGEAEFCILLKLLKVF